MNEDPTPRVPPVEAPYEPEVADLLDRMMPRSSPVEPLRLFRTFARHPGLGEAILPLGRFLLGKGLHLPLRDREIVIDRVCGRCGCEYEWGVHAAFFGAKAGLSALELEATAAEGPPRVWSERDALLVRLVDELHDGSRVSDSLWTELARHWSAEQLLELLVLAGWYHAIAYVANGARVGLETWAARFPAAVSS